jgi:hypothetical protein
MPFRALLQNERLLSVRKLLCLHRLCSSSQGKITENSNLQWSNFLEADQRHCGVGGLVLAGVDKGPW